MRDDKTVLKEILDFVTEDDNLKIAVLNGSRVNPNAPIDFMQDYDVRVYVEDLPLARSYKKDREWIKRFGQLVMLQQNNMDDGSFIFLLQYNDGVRIDLSFQARNKIEEEFRKDSLSCILLDKQLYVKDPPAPSDDTYIVKRPPRKEWDETLNELWWLQGYIAKELWRNEIPLVKGLYDVYFMDCLRKLVIWYTCSEKDWNLNPGKYGKWLGRYLPKDLYEEFIYFYSGAQREEQWEKLLKAGAFIRKIGTHLAEKLAYPYPYEEDKNVSEYVRKIYGLSSDAESL